MAFDTASRQPAISMECVQGGPCAINQAGYNCASVASKVAAMHEFASGTPVPAEGCTKAVVGSIAADALTEGFAKAFAQTGGAQ